MSSNDLFGNVVDVHKFSKTQLNCSANHGFFFLDNHQEYIEKAIKPIAKKKHKDMRKRKKLIYYSKQQKDYLRFLITP
jgi:hypothetical protein